MVFAGLYPTESNQYGALRDAIEKLRLNDASLICEPETSQALGFGLSRGVPRAAAHGNRAGAAASANSASA